MTQQLDRLNRRIEILTEKVRRYGWRTHYAAKAQVKADQTGNQASIISAYNKWKQDYDELNRLEEEHKKLIAERNALLKKSKKKDSQTRLNPRVIGVRITSNGQQIGMMDPETFREGAGARKSMFIQDVVKEFNAYNERTGKPERAEIAVEGMRTNPKVGRDANWGESEIRGHVLRLREEGQDDASIRRWLLGFGENVRPSARMVDKVMKGMRTNPEGPHFFKPGLDTGDKAVNSFTGAYQIFRANGTVEDCRCSQCAAKRYSSAVKASESDPAVPGYLKNATPYDNLKQITAPHIIRVHDSVSHTGGEKCPVGPRGVYWEEPLNDLVAYLHTTSDFPEFIVTKIFMEIVGRQPFQDCNHRTAWAMALQVLRYFDATIEAPEGEKVKMLGDIYKGLVPEERVVIWVGQYLRELNSAEPSRSSVGAARLNTSARIASNSSSKVININRGQGIKDFPRYRE